MAEMTVLVKDHESIGIIPHSPNVKVLRHPHLDVLDKYRNIFVLWAASDLEQVSDFVRVANQSHHLRALFVREDTPTRWLPQLLVQSNVKTLRNMIVHSAFDVPKRVLAAWQMGAQKELIADADISKDKLLVTTCAMEYLEVPLKHLHGLGESGESERKVFDIADDGSYVCWPNLDVHVDLETLRCAVDPERKAASERARFSHDKKIGAALALLRRRYGLRQSDITGLSERHVRRIENGESTSYEAYRHFAKAFGKEVGDLLDELAVAANEVKL